MTKKLKIINYLKKNHHLEESNKNLVNELNNVIIKLEKKESNQELNEKEKLLNDYRKNYNDVKIKYDDLVKINADFKQKVIENENNKIASNDFKGLVKKNSLLQKKIDELIKENEKNKDDLNYKEERLQALRFMNSKLEQKSAQILEKWENFKLYEEKKQRK